MGFLGGAGMAGAAGGANQALQNYLNFYMQNKQLGLEREKYGEQKLNWAEQRKNWAAERAEREFKTEQEKAMRTDLSGLYAPRPEMGMMSTGGPFVPQGEFAVDPSLDLPMATGQMIPGKPTTEQLMGVLGKYDPKSAVTAQVSMRNVDERLTHAIELQNVKSSAEAQRLYDKLESQEKMWRERDDARSQAIADKFDTKMKELEKLYELKGELQAAKEVKPPTPTDKDKLYESYLADIKKRGEKPMTRYQFDIWMAKQKPDRFQDLIDALKPGGVEPPADTKRKPLSSFGR